MPTEPFQPEATPSEAMAEKASDRTSEAVDAEDIPITVEVPADGAASAVPLPEAVAIRAQRYPSPFGPGATMLTASPNRRYPSPFDSNRPVGAQSPLANVTLVPGDLEPPATTAVLAEEENDPALRPPVDDGRDAEQKPDPRWAVDDTDQKSDPRRAVDDASDAEPTPAPRGVVGHASNADQKPDLPETTFHSALQRSVTGATMRPAQGAVEAPPTSEEGSDSRPAFRTVAVRPGESLGPAALDIIPDFRPRPKVSRATIILGAATVVLTMLIAVVASQPSSSAPVSAMSSPTLAAPPPAASLASPAPSATPRAPSAALRTASVASAQPQHPTSAPSSSSVRATVPSARVEPVRRTRVTATKKSRAKGNLSSEETKSRAPLGHFVPDEL